MTKEAYFEMCEMMNSEPIEEQIPLDFEDLFLEAQLAFSIYYKLRDEWDGFNGNYLGKNYSGLLDLFTILEVPVEDHKTMYSIIGIIDFYRSKLIQSKKPTKDAKAS